MSAIHRSRRRAFESYSFTVVTTAMTRTLKLVLACLPVRRATQMSATSINDKQPIRSPGDPDPILLLPLRIDAQSVVGRRTDSESAGWLRIERGRKNRRNIRKHVVRNPATLAHTIQRRILLTGGSGVLSTTFPGAQAASSRPPAGAALRAQWYAGGAPAATVSPGCGSRGAVGG